NDLPNKSRYVEVTNWFLVRIEDTQGHVEDYSIVQTDRKTSLKNDILKYTSHAHFNPLKAAKRYWNYLFELKQTSAVLDQLKKLAPLFSSYIAFLNSIATDIALQKRLLRDHFITQSFYNTFINDTINRLQYYYPKCYYNNYINQHIQRTMNVNDIDDIVNKLT